jgi:hypothetical protein
MLNQTEYLTPKRRVVFAWVIIVVALLGQFSGLPGIANIFLIFTAVVIHSMLVKPIPQAWIGRTVKIATLIFVPTIVVLHSIHRMPPENVVYGVIALFAIPFLISQLVSDLKRMNQNSKE